MLTPERRKRIVEHAEVLFKPEWTVHREKHEIELREAQFKARKTNNSAAMVPAEVECFVSHAKELTLAKAQAIAAAFTAFNEPSDDEGFKELSGFCASVFAGRKATFISHVTRRAVRTGVALPHITSLVMSFDRAASDAMQEGRRILEKQKVAIENSSPMIVAAPAPPPSYVVDTCIFNWLTDRKIAIDALPSPARFVITHVQMDEINKTKDEERRVRLFLTLTKLNCELVATNTFLWDISRFDLAKWGNGEIYEKLKGDLDALNGGKRGNNIRDALIAEVAIANGYTLLTADKDLKEVCEAHGGKVLFFAAIDT